jgi:two-component system response regulator PilR (NtrC family)
MVEKRYNILVVEDELSMRELLEYMLEKKGYRVVCAANGKEALSKIKKEHYDLLLCDIRLGDTTGLEVLKASKKMNPHVTVIMISAFANTETAVEAMNQGAFDYVPKPFENQELLQTIANALERKTLDKDKRAIDNELKESVHFGKIVGNSPRMLHIYEMIRQVAKTKSSVLITGESGTGKELIAKAIHEQSDRRDQPFVTINCGGIPETLLESEFFGHRKGAFTGASTDKQGLMEIAHTGTFFLDEIAELSIPMQVKLLRAVQERVFRPVLIPEFCTHTAIAANARDFFRFGLNCRGYSNEPLSVAALRNFWSKTPWQFMQYVFKINHDISMQEIFCINCAATR